MHNKQGKIIICVLTFILGLLTTLTYQTVKDNKKSYEYALNGKIGVSNNCYSVEDVAVCEVDNAIIKVQNYYEID